MRSVLSLFMSAVILLSAFAIALGTGTAAAHAAEAGSSFRYEHDPRLNPKAMGDIIVDPSAVYGFSPNPDGGLAAYAAYDWSDAEAVAAYKESRLEFLASYAEMYELMDEMRAAGKTTEEIARAVSAKRNELRIRSYDGDPDGLATLKERNLAKYGHEEGPLPDELYEQYGSWEIVMEKAFTHNPGMDACVGIYDDYYTYYIAFGYIEDEKTAPVSRAYTAAVLMEAAGLPYSACDLSAFADSDAISPWLRESMETAVSAGIVLGYKDGTLHPEQSIRRVEAFAILARCLPELTSTEGAAAFSDVPKWAKADLDRLSAAGIAAGYPDGRLGADDFLTAAQLKQLAERLQMYKLTDSRPAENTVQ